MRLLSSAPIQESSTSQLADVIQDELHQAVGLVVVEAAHSCLGTRGARTSRSAMTATAHRGRLRDEPGLREEAHRLIAIPRVHSPEPGADSGSFRWTEAS